MVQDDGCVWMGKLGEQSRRRCRVPDFVREIMDKEEPSERVAGPSRMSRNESRWLSCVEFSRQTSIAIRVRGAVPPVLFFLNSACSPKAQLRRNISKVPKKLSKKKKKDSNSPSSQTR